MSSIVYYGSARQVRLLAEESLPAKLDLILNKLNLSDRVKKEKVVIKLHVGLDIGYSTIHPVFVRKVVKAVKDGGGYPFVVDIDWDTRSATERGYTAEVLGCPVYPAAGPGEKYFYTHQREFKNIKEWNVAGMIQDATFLINFAHVKGHPSCSYGGAIKNLALGCMVGNTRSAMHDTCHFEPYWFSEYCPDSETRKKIRQACPFGALVEDKEKPGNLHLHIEPCNQCGRCLKVAPPGSLKIDPANFQVFQEACAISTAITLSTFEPGKAVHLNLATHMTPVCDCFGFTGMPIMQDVGILGSEDIVALEQATLDLTGKERLIEESIPASMEVQRHAGHPLSWLHGPLKDPYKAPFYTEKLGLGSRDYELTDIMPIDKIEPGPPGYIAASVD